MDFLTHTSVCTTNDVAAITRTLEKGKTVEPHWHNFYEIEIILSGSMIHKIGDKKFLLTRGDAYLISSNGFHSMEFPEETTLLNIGFRSELLNDELRYFSNIDLRTICGKFSDKEIAKIMDLVNDINTEVSQSALLNTTVISSIISQIVIMLLRVSPSTKTAGATNTLVQKTLAYINEHFFEDVSLENIARQLSVTPNYLGKIFNKRSFYG